MPCGAWAQLRLPREPHEVLVAERAVLGAPPPRGRDIGQQVPELLRGLRRLAKGLVVGGDDRAERSCIDRLCNQAVESLAVCAVEAE
eukprot:2797321-Alexandrium_andersonii.AAC.1